MAKTIALIVAGSGQTDLDEVTDLLNDAYPEDKVEVDLIVPVSKPMFTDAVQHAVEWLGNDDYVTGVALKGGSMTRASSKFSTNEVEKFTDILDPKEFKDWDEVHVLLAIPEESEEDPADYEMYADIAEAAIDAGFPVKNLCMALDDVVLAEDEPEPEPEPEPEEKPKRTRRARAEKDEEPEEEKPEPKVTKATKRERTKTVEKDEPTVAPVPEKATISVDDYVKALADIQAAVEFLELNDKMFALRNLADEVIYAPITLAAGRALDVLSEARPTHESPEPSEAQEEPEEPAAEAPKRGRGRPRTNFEEKQVWDDEENEWIKHPRGRVAKGTKWRVIHTESGDVLDEGVV